MFTLFWFAAFPFLPIEIRVGNQKQEDFSSSTSETVPSVVRDRDLVRDLHVEIW